MQSVNVVSFGGGTKDETNKKYENHYPLYEWGVGSRGVCARDRAGRASKAGEKFLFLLPFHEEEGN